MKRYYSDPNKTSVAMAPSGETKEIHSFRKYTLGKTKEFLRTTEMEFLDISHSLLLLDLTLIPPQKNPRQKTIPAHSGFKNKKNAGNKKIQVY